MTTSAKNWILEFDTWSGTGLKTRPLVSWRMSFYPDWFIITVYRKFFKVFTLFTKNCCLFVCSFYSNRLGQNKQSSKLECLSQWWALHFDKLCVHVGKKEKQSIVCSQFSHQTLVSQVWSCRVLPFIWGKVKIGLLLESLNIARPNCICLDRVPHFSRKCVIFNSVKNIISLIQIILCVL